MPRFLSPFSTAIAVTAFIGPPAFSAATPKPSPLASDEKVLVSYEISSDAEQQFGTDSTGVSAFWGEWKTRRLSHACLTPLKEPAEGISLVQDEFDAQMLVYSAYGEKGVYFLFDIVDDDYPGQLSTKMDWAYDVAELIMDRFPSSVLYAQPRPHFCDTSGRTGLTVNTVQIQVSCGGATPAQTLNVNHFDTAGDRCNSRAFTHRLSIQDASAQRGLFVRTVKVNGMRRMQEWLVPYSLIGYPGLQSKPGVGSRSALVINYNDTDTLDLLNQGVPKKLTWGGRGNPFGRKRVWGDLEFGRALDQPQPRGITPGQGKTASGTRRTMGAGSYQGPQTPPMGWNPWNAFGTRVTEEIAKESADSMVSKGLLKAGYIYMNLDGGGKYPSGQQTVADYFRAKGFRFGVYGNHSPRMGIVGNEEEWARKWASWGADYVKYDAYVLPLGHSTWIRMRNALAATGRPMVYSGHCADETIDESLPSTAHVWRTGPDIFLPGEERPSFKKALRNIFLNNKAADLAGPGFWNDPDFLLVGLPDGLTLEEERTQFGLWAITAAPLLIGCDIRKISDSSLRVLTNEEAIAVNQDPLGHQGRIVKNRPGNVLSIWLKHMSDSSRAVLVLNASGVNRNMTLRWRDIGCTGKLRVRDLWSHREVGNALDSLAVSLPSRGSLLLRVWSNPDASN